VTSPLSGCTGSEQLRRIFHSAAILALLFVGCFLLHWRAGTLHSEFGRYQDEGMHYVTGLLLHDFVTSGQWSAPMRFTEQFYLHFPKVGLGNWPPGFESLQAVWTLIFGVSRVSLLLCMFLLTALLAFAVYRAAAAWFGVCYALLAASLVIAAPLTQEQAAMVMAEILLALTSFLAMLAFTRFLKWERTFDALAFAFWTVAAILTKGNGWLVVFIVPIVLLATRTLRLLRNARLWMAAFLIAIPTVPYTLFTMRIVTQGWDTRTFPGFDYLFRSFGIHTWFAVSILGVPLTVIAVAGFVDRALMPWLRRQEEPFWVVMAVYGAAVVIFHTAVPTSIEPRKIYQLAPVVCLFVPAGLSAIARRIPPPLVRPVMAWHGLAAVAAMLFLVSRFSPLAPYAPGFGPAVENLIARPDTRGAAILISSNPFMTDSEAALIAEWAERERHAGTYLVRGTKLLARPSDRGVYMPIFQTQDEVRQALAAVPISYVILHTTSTDRSYRHHALLRAALEAHPEEWELIYRTSGRALDALHHIEVYRCRKNLQGVPVRLSVNLTNKLGRSLDTNSRHD